MGVVDFGGVVFVCFRVGIVKRIDFYLKVLYFSLFR